MCLDIMKKINIFDNYILSIIKKYAQNKYLDKLMPIITSMGNLGIVWIAMSIALLLNRSYRIIGDIVLLTLIISTIIGEGIVKHLVRRVRPCNDESKVKLLIGKPITYSFPSGHTLSSFAVAEILSKYFSNYSLIFICIAFLIALSRLYLLVHYPTDVIAGIIFGLLCSKLVFVILQGGYLQKLIFVYKGIR